MPFTDQRSIVGKFMLDADAVFQTLSNPAITEIARQALVSPVYRDLDAEVPRSTAARQWFDADWLPRVKSPYAPAARVGCPECAPCNDHFTKRSGRVSNHSKEEQPMRMTVF